VGRARGHQVRGGRRSGTTEDAPEKDAPWERTGAAVALSFPGSIGSLRRHAAITGRTLTGSGADATGGRNHTIVDPDHDHPWCGAQPLAGHRPRLPQRSLAAPITLIEHADGFYVLDGRHRVFEPPRDGL
jgi:hypothetical protein